MFAFRLIVCWTILLVACSGVGGGVDGGGSAGNDDGSWLTLRPDMVSEVVFPGFETQILLNATATRSFEQSVQVAIIDANGVTKGPPSLNAYSATRYSASFHLADSLAPGRHDGTFDVRLCFDDPSTCLNPLPGSPWHVGYRIFVVDPAVYTFKKWEDVTHPGFDLFTLGTLGSDAVAVAVGYYSGATEVYTSPTGVNWTSVTTAHAPLATRGFALATVGTNLYLSGGERIGPIGKPLGTYTNHVWRFDGADWHEQTASAPFDGRRDHAMVGFGGALYVFGGRNGSVGFSDAWKSVDEGVTWTAMPGGPLPANTAGTVCAVEWRGRLLIAGSGSLISSSDAATWTTVPGYEWPFAIYATHCAVLNDRLYLFGDSTVSSADLTTWQFEPWARYGESAPGMVAVDGHLLLGNGVHSSFRSIMRSRP